MKPNESISLIHTTKHQPSLVPIGKITGYSALVGGLGTGLLYFAQIAKSVDVVSLSDCLGFSWCNF